MKFAKDLEERDNRIAALEDQIQKLAKVVEAKAEAKTKGG